MRRFDNPMNQCEFCTDRSGNPIAAVTMLAIGVAMGMVLITGLKRCEPSPMHRIGELDCQQCHSRKAALAEYFRRAGHPEDPVKLAEATLKTSQPRILAALAVAENSPAKSKRGGYHKRHVGVWQISKANAKAYGKTPPDVVGQAAQADRLLRDLLDEYPVKVAVSKWGGEVTTDKYSRFVMAELVRVP